MNPNELMTDAELDAIGFTFSLQTFDTPQGKRQFAREAIAAALVKLTQVEDGLLREASEAIFELLTAQAGCEIARTTQFDQQKRYAGALIKAQHRANNIAQLMVEACPAPSQQEDRKPLTDKTLRVMHHIDEFGLVCFVAMTSLNKSPAPSKPPTELRNSNDHRTEDAYT